MRKLLTFSTLLLTFISFSQSWNYSSGENVLRLDSIVEVEFDTNSKYEITYDTNGNQILYIRYQWNTDSQSFIPTSKKEYTYDYTKMIQKVMIGKLRKILFYQL